MIMSEPSEAWLDWHFKTQMVIYTEEDLPAACLSDRVIMARWLKVFEAAPASQKMARNSLMLLMHGHMEDFGFLRAPFTDVNNCHRDLNKVINGYHGISNLKPLIWRSSKDNNQENKRPQRQAGGRSEYRSRTLKRVPNRSNLEPIAEVSEPSIAIESDFQRTPLVPTRNNVREKVEAIERELARNKSPPLRRSCRRDAEPSFRMDSQDPHYQRTKPRGDSPSPPPLKVPPTKNVRKCNHQSYCNDTEESSPNQDSHSQSWRPSLGCSSPVQNLRNCFEEMSVRLNKPTELPKTGQSHRMSYQQDKIVTDLLRQQEELRQQCLVYYNLDGTLKNDEELLAATSLTEDKIEGFAIGARGALERLKSWRGKPNQLKFFRTLFRGCGIESDVTGQIKALDCHFERVALKWLRSKRRYHSGGANSEELKALKAEYMAHVEKIRRLCEIHCHGIIPSDVLSKMYQRLDMEYETVERLDYQQMDSTF